MRQLLMRSGSISWVSIHFDGSSSSISWISVHCNVITIWILLFSAIIIHCDLFLELVPMLVIQAGKEDTDQSSNNKCDNKCSSKSYGNCCSYGKLIIWFISSCIVKYILHNMYACVYIYTYMYVQKLYMVSCMVHLQSNVTLPYLWVCVKYTYLCT